MLSGEAPTLEVNVGQMWLSGLDSNFGLTTVAGDERRRQQEQQEREIGFEREQRNTQPRGLRKRNAIIFARASGWEDLETRNMVDTHMPRDNTEPPTQMGYSNDGR